MALVLYLAVTAAIVFVWSRRIAPISRGAAVALLLLPMTFTGRALLTNRVYGPIDLPFQFPPLQSMASQYGLETPHNIALSDLHAQMIPWQKAFRHALSLGEWPLWNPFILSGDILAAAAQPAVYDPLNWIALVLPIPHALTFGASMTFFFAGFFTFVFARSIGLREGPSLVAAAGFAFCAMLAFFVGWPLGRAWTFLPLVLFSVREKRWAMLTLALTLLIVAGHPETVLHVVTIGVIYGIREVRSYPKAILAGVTALGLTAIYLLPFAEAAEQTIEHKMRTGYFAEKPYWIRPEVRTESIARSFVPGPKGDPRSTRVGFAILLLALFARRREAWFFAVLAVAGFLITCGIPPLPHLLHELPLYKITLNDRLAFAASFALAMLAGMGADRWPRLAPLLLAVVLVERTLEDGGIYPALDAKAFYPKIPQLAALKHDELFRVAGTYVTLLPNGAAMYGLEDVRGYQAMTFRRYMETYPFWSRYTAIFFNPVNDLSRPFLSFLNVRYFLDGPKVIENPNVLPRAFIPPRIRFERNENVVHQMSLATDFAGMAWIENETDTPHERVNATGQVRIRRNGLAYELDAKLDADGWIVVSESAWKGWRAYIDGKRVRTHYANHAFLGLFVPAGQHRIRLVYLPESFVRGRMVTIATILAVAIFAGARRRSARPDARRG